MPVLDVSVIGREDQPPWQDVAGRVKATATIERAAVLQSGMKSGATSVALLIPLDDGTFVFAETSASILRALVAAIDGAEERWGLPA